LTGLGTLECEIVGHVGSPAFKLVQGCCWMFMWDRILLMKIKTEIF